MRSIVQLADYGGPYPGNFVASLKVLGDAVAGLGLRQVLVFSDIAKDRQWAKELQEEGTRIYFLSKNVRLAGTARSIADIAKKENAAILHTHFASFDVPAWLARAHLKATGATRVPVIWHDHSECFDRSLKRVVKDFIKYRLMGRSVAVVAVSEGVRESLLQRGCSPSRSRVVPNGIDAGCLRAGSGSGGELRRQFGIREDAIVILAFGWDPVRKGIDVLLRAVGSLAAKYPSLLLLLVGEQQLADFLGQELGDTWPAWLRLTRPVSDVAGLYALADLFASPSRHEGFTYSVGETLANGLPVVLSDIPGHAWAHAVPSAVSCKPGEVESLAGAILKVLDWDERTRRLNGAASATFINQHYSVQAWARKVCQVYMQVLNSGSRSLGQTPTCPTAEPVAPSDQCSAAGADR